MEPERYKVDVDIIDTSFKKLALKGFVTVAQWSFETRGLLPLITVPVGDLTTEEKRKVDLALRSIKPEILREFSFTGLIVENDKEVGFLFTPAFANQVLRIQQGDTSWIEVFCAENTDGLIEELCSELASVGVTKFGGYSLENDSETLKPAITKTLASAIFGVFNHGIQHIYFIPIIVALRMKRIGGIFAVNTFSNIDQSTLFSIIRPIANSLMSPSFLEEIDAIRHRASIMQAVAAIMGRNMSHNIGSHAIWHLAEHLKNSGNYELQEIQRFLRYLQKRMDFIAQVSTSAPAWCLTMEWSSRPDDESTVMGGFTTQKCLLDNIAWSYKVRYDSKWFNSSVSDEQKPEIKLVISQDGSSNVSVNIPHGQVGAQAFYTILENLIRNTSKYGDKSNAAVDGRFKSLEFTVKVEDDWDDGGKEWRDDYYRVSIRDNWTSKQATVKQSNEALVAHIIDPTTGELKPGNWGMKEIKICTAYLRMLRPEEIDRKYNEWKDGKAKEPPVIEVKLTNDDWTDADEQGHLTYVLYLLRPKQALLIGEALKQAVEAAQATKT
jgi:hypothetical protein